MPLEKTLRKVEYDIQNGDLEKAKLRLNGLLCHFAYPSNLLVRRKLGDIHYHLGNVREAGKYWYLVEDKSPEMEQAIRLYEKACGHNPYVIGYRMNAHHIDIHAVCQQSEYAANMLVEMRDLTVMSSDMPTLYIRDIRTREHTIDLPQPKKLSFFQWVVTIIALLVFVFVIIPLVISVGTLLVLFYLHFTGEL